MTTMLTLVVGVLMIGGTLLFTTKYSYRLLQWLPFLERQWIRASDQEDTPVLKLAVLPVEQRYDGLQKIAQEGKSLEKARARYLLAADLIQQQEGQKALKWLKGLESQHPILAPYIALKRAQAYDVEGDLEQGLKAWQTLLKDYGKHPAAAEALYVLLSQDSPYQNLLKNNPANVVDKITGASPDNPKFWTKAIQYYPSHPRILDLAQERLEQQEGDRFLLMGLLAKYHFEEPGISLLLDQFVSQYSDRFEEQDWEVVALGYWNDRKYAQASDAYTKIADQSNYAYLAARGLHLSEQRKQAKKAYKEMVETFPNAPEAPDALLAIAKLELDIEAVPYYDQVIEQFPEHAPEALLAKAKILDRLQSDAAADRARQRLIEEYGSSNTAAIYRWGIAQDKAKRNQLEEAVQWAAPILDASPDSSPARQAGFWLGKWWRELGEEEKAKAAFEQVIATYPWSYYAWRSAVMLGWDVGDFNTVGRLLPQEINGLPPRPILPTPLLTLQELYQLNQPQDAWTFWQSQFQTRLQPTIEEQFIDGLLRLEVGDSLRGIDRIGKLEDRTSPEDQKEFTNIQQQPLYWQGLYPFPYQQLVNTYSQEYDVNPLLVIAVMRQESRFIVDIKSSAEAIGLMQIIPSTADLIAQKINLKEYDLTNPQDNIQMGTWLLNQNQQIYGNNALLAIASYNAGTVNVNRWIQQQGLQDLDQFIDTIPFTETQDYVKQVFGNYWNYVQLYNPQVQQRLISLSQF